MSSATPGPERAVVDRQEGWAAELLEQSDLPLEYDCRWEPIIGRLGVTSVTVAGSLFMALGTAAVLGLGLADPQVWWNESEAVYWAETALSVWAFGLLLIVVRVSTHRRWLVLVPLTIGVLLVFAVPYFPFWVLG